MLATSRGKLSSQFSKLNIKRISIVSCCISDSERSAQPSLILPVARKLTIKTFLLFQQNFKLLL